MDVLEEILKSQLVEIVEELIEEVVVRGCIVADEFSQFGFEFFLGKRCVKRGIVAVRVHLVIQAKVVTGHVPMDFVKCPLLLAGCLVGCVQGGACAVQ